MKPRPPVLRAPGQLHQRGDDRRGTALDEQALCRVTPPSVGVRQRLDQLRRRDRLRHALRIPPRRLVHDPVDAAVRVRGFQLVLDDVIAEVLGDVGALLDDAAVHVHDVQRAVGPVGQVDGTEALVGGREKLSPLVCLAGAQRRAVVFDDDAAHEVGGGLGHEHVSVQLGRQPIATEHERRADGGEPVERSVFAANAELIGAIRARSRPRRPHDVDGVFGISQRLVAATGAHQVRVAHEVRRGHEVHVHRRLVRVAVDPAHVVVRDAPFAARQALLHFELAVLQAQNLVAVRRVHPVVEAPVKAVGVLLDACFPGPVERGDLLLLVHPEVAVGVVHQPGVRGLADEHALVEHFQRPRQDQAVGEHGPLVHLPVVVHVLEDDDAADRLHVGLGRREIRHEARHLDRPQTPRRIPVDDDGILDHRLAGHELEVIARRHVEGLQGVGGRQRRRLIRDLLDAWRPLLIRGRRLKAEAGDGRGDDEDRDRPESGQKHEVKGPLWFRVYGCFNDMRGGLAISSGANADGSRRGSTPNGAAFGEPRRSLPSWICRQAKPPGCRA